MDNRSLNLGSNLYQGQVCDGKPNGKGNLFDTRKIQYINGIFHDGNLIELYSAKIIEQSAIVHNIKKFNGNYLYDCDSLGTVAVVNIPELENIKGTLSFDDISAAVEKQMNVLEILSDPIWNDLKGFLKEFKSKCKRITWVNDDNLPLHFSNLAFYADKVLGLGDYLKDMCFANLLWHVKLHKVLSLVRNKVGNQGKNIFLKKFNEIVTLSFKSSLILILQKMHGMYIKWILKNNPNLEASVFEELNYPIGFTIRRLDLVLYFDQVQNLGFSSNSSKRLKHFVNTLIENYKPMEHIVPIVACSYPNLYKFVSNRLVQLSGSDTYAQMLVESIEFDLSYELQYDSVDTVYIKVYEKQVELGIELLKYYKPGAPVKSKQICGPNDDYSTWCCILQTRSRSFISPLSRGRGQLPDELRIWLDLTDIGFVTAYEYKKLQLSSSEQDIIKTFSKFLIDVAILQRFKTLNDQNMAEYEISKHLLTQTVLISNLIIVLIEDKSLMDRLSQVNDLQNVWSTVFGTNILANPEFKTNDLRKLRKVLNTFIDLNLGERKLERVNTVSIHIVNGIVDNQSNQFKCSDLTDP